MPDLQKLHSFLGRTNSFLQQALQSGDRQQVEYYERLLDRANSLGERVINGGGVASGPSPITVAGPQEQPQSQAQPAQTQSPGLAPPSTQGQSLVDLKSLNGQSPSTKLQLDLDQELKPVTSPFTGQQANPIQKAMDQYPTAKPAPYSGPTSANPYATPSSSGSSPQFNSMMYTDGLQTSGSGQGMSPTSALGATDWLKPGQPGPLAKMGGPYWEVLGEPKPTTEVTPIEPEQAVVEPSIGGEPETMPSRFEIDPELRARYDNVQGLSQEQQAANTAEFVRKAEFEKRVKEEHGEKPSFLMQLLGMLLGGLRGVGDVRQDKARYMAGRASVGKEMRGEVAARQAMDYRSKKDSLNRELEQRKAMGVLLPKAIRAQQEPLLQRARSLSGQIQAIERGVNPDQARIMTIQQEMEKLIDEADRIASVGYKSTGFTVPPKE